MALTKIPSELSSTTGIVDNSNATAITIDSNENVGIGTTSPSGAYAQPSLHIHASGNGAELHLTDGTTGATSSDGMSIFQYANDGYIHMRENGSLRTYINGSERMRIDSAGNVGIGTTSPTFKLDVAGNARANYFALRANESAPSESAFVYRPATGVLGFGTSSAERMRIDSSGRVLIGTTAGSFNAKITAEGGGNYIFESRQAATTLIGHFVFRNGNGAVGSIQTSGTSTIYNTSSDQRLKENIADADDAGSKVDAIQVRQYDWKADGSHQDYGVIAQELVEVAPEAVTVPTDSEEMMGVDYSKLVPMLIKEIQSLRNRVAQLEE